MLAVPYVHAKGGTGRISARADFLHQGLACRLEECGPGMKSEDLAPQRWVQSMLRLVEYCTLYPHMSVPRRVREGNRVIVTSAPEVWNLPGFGIGAESGRRTDHN